MATPALFDCGLGPALKVIAGKWRPTIIWSLHTGPVRFGELRRRVLGVSEKILFEELRALEGAGIVRREVLGVRPAAVQYSLTPAGAELNQAVHALAEWGQRHCQGRDDADRLRLVGAQDKAAPVDGDDRGDA